MKQDIKSISKSILVVGPVVLDEDNAPDAVDLISAKGTKFDILVGVGGITFDADNKIEISMTHCDTESGEYANVTAADVSGVASVTSGIVKSLVAAHAAASVTSIGYKGGKRFVKFVINFTGTHGTGTPIAIIGFQTNPYVSPVV